jgi:hypothetical protein
MSGIDGHSEAKKLLQIVRSCESRSTVAAAFSGARRWEQALVEYSTLCTAGSVPAPLRAAFYVRKASVLVLGAGAIQTSQVREGLACLSAAEGLLGPALAAASKDPSTASTDVNAQKIQQLHMELLKCRVELLLAVNDVEAAAAAAAKNAASHPSSEEFRQMLKRVISRQKAPSDHVDDSNIPGKGVPRPSMAGAWARSARGDRGKRDHGEEAEYHAAPSSSSDDEDFSSLDPYRRSSRTRSQASFKGSTGPTRPQSARGAAAPSAGSSAGHKTHRPLSARLQRPPEHYQTLGIPATTATAGVVKAYRELALRWHPDRWSACTPEQKLAAEGTFKKIQHAYSVIGDPTMRMAYDKSLGL